MKRLRGERGAAAVEFALLAVLLLIIIFGILEFGFLWLQSYYIANAAREGARVAATLPEPKTTDRAQVENTVKEYLNDIDLKLYADRIDDCCGNSDFISVDVTDGDTIHVAGPPALDVPTIKVTVTVQTSQIWKPVLWDLLKLLPGSTATDINEVSEYAVFAVQS